MTKACCSNDTGTGRKCCAMGERTIMDERTIVDHIIGLTSTEFDEAIRGGKVAFLGRAANIPGLARKLRWTRHLFRSGFTLGYSWEEGKLR